MLKMNVGAMNFSFIIQICLALLFILSCNLSSAQTGELAFNATSFKRLSVSSDAIKSKFKWPKSTDFRETFVASIDASPITIVRGDVISVYGTDLNKKVADYSWENINKNLSLFKKDESLEVSECNNTSYMFYKENNLWEGISVDREDCYLRLAELKNPPESQEISIVSNNENNRITVFKPEKILASNNIDPALWDAWTYSSTLLKLDKPLYNIPQAPYVSYSKKDLKKYYEDENRVSNKLENILKSEDKKAIEKIRNALAQPVLPSDYVMQSAALFAEKAGDLDLAIDVRSRFKPVGRCSMDTWPQEAAREYAELCFNKGDLACFLNLQVKIMAQNFERVAYSSYGEKIHYTEAERLRSIGIDVEKFLKGLIYQFQVPSEHERENISTWRLARSIVEANLVDEFTPYLRNIALDSSIDEYNRLRATQVWAYSTFYNRQKPGEDNYKEAINSVISEIELEPLSEVSRSWFEDQFKRSE